MVFPTFFQCNILIQAFCERFAAPPASAKTKFVRALVWLSHYLKFLLTRVEGVWLFRLWKKISIGNVPRWLEAFGTLVVK